MSLKATNEVKRATNALRSSDPQKLAAFRVTTSSVSYEDTLKRNIEYDFFIAHDKRKELVKEILQIMVDAGCSRNPYIRIGRDEKPTYVVRDRFLKLDSSHIEYVLDCLEKNQQEVRNVKQYILATLYNASMTIDNYYQQMVQHDMANW